MKAITLTLLAILFCTSSCLNFHAKKTDQIKNNGVDLDTVAQFTEIITDQDSAQNYNEKRRDIEQTADTTFTEVEMGNITSYFYPGKTLNDAYIILLSKKYPDIKYLKTTMPLNDIQYKDEGDDVKISYVFHDKANLNITLEYAGGVTTIGLSHNAEGSTITITMAAD